MAPMPLDPVASLMLDEAGPLPARVLVLDDPDGSLVRAVAELGVEVRGWADDVRAEAAIPPDLQEIFENWQKSTTAGRKSNW